MSDRDRPKKPALGIKVISRRLFDDVIDCIYEYDLGQELPMTWPPHVRDEVERARIRILRRVAAGASRSAKL